jgi:glutamate-1-semialdehyde 2,1-aminomutase
LPVGALCGRADLMKRFREDRPADICFARGTFNSHPYVMGAMCEFLERLGTEPIRAYYQDLDETWNRRARSLNDRLRAAGLPVQVSNLSSVWTVGYTKPSRYNWMFQYYLRAQGLALSWVGTGRLIFSLDYTEEHFTRVADRFVAAARAMQRDAWWWSGEQLSNKAIRRQILQESIQTRWRASSTTSSMGSMSSPRSRWNGDL